MKGNISRNCIVIALTVVIFGLLTQINAETTDSNDNECKFGHMECAVTKKCVPLSWKCDGDNDCGEDDGTDEQNCPPKTCATHEFACGDGTCVPDRWTCDGEPDCAVNQTDEDPQMCMKKTQCSDDMFSCGDGVCISNNWKCDGSPDCEDERDELNCTATCTMDMFACDNGQCIANGWVCDGDPDCMDGSDENNCDPTECKPGEFSCKDASRCIDIKWKCDGDFDCSDHSDEDGNCTGIVEPECSPSEFRCTITPECIHKSWECDGDPDCTDGTDEHPDCIYSCPEHKFMCNDKYCISASLRCDHTPDCQDGSDEFNCNVTVSCEDRGEFDCYGDGLYCISMEKVCDGQNDCQHREDELPELCKTADKCSGKQCGEHSHCEEVFKLDQKEAKCVCDAGFEYHEEEKVCKDIDECKERGVCSQTCINTKGGYKCECLEGYVLEKHHFCRAEGEKPWLYYANRRDIRRLRVDSRYMEIIVEETTNSIALDIDYKNGLIFWTDGGIEEIKSARITGDRVLAQDELTVISNKGGAFSPDGIAVDWLNMHIYWTDTGPDVIRVADYKGTMVKTLLNSDLDEPRALCVDPQNGYMYWSDWGKTPKIERAGMDGNNREVIVSQGDGLEWPNGLTVDYVQQRIYWIDSKLHKIGSAKLDGSDHYNVLIDMNEIQRPFAISVFEDSLYWTDWQTNKILSVNKHHGHSPHTLSLGSYSVMDIKVYHEKRQNMTFAEQAKKKCEDASCQYFCLPMANLNNTAVLSDVTCACPDGKKLDDNKRTCSDAPIPPSTKAPTEKPTPKPTPTTPKVEPTTGGGYTVVPPGGKNKTHTPESQDNMSNVGVIAGIAATVAVVILVIGFVISCIVYRRYKAKNKKSMNFDNPVYRKTTTTEEQCMIQNEDVIAPQMQPLNPHHENV